jgi:starch synthase
MTQQKIIYVTPEVFPFAKFTSMAELCSGLTKYIKEYGHEIRVVMPKYKFINDSKHVLRDVIRLKEVPVEIKGEKRIASVKSSFIIDSKVQIYFVEIDEFFNYDSFYDKAGNIVPSTLKELAFFSKAVFELLKILHWSPDVFHGNDWQAALVPYYLNNDFKNDEFYEGVKSIFSVHNTKKTGSYDLSIFDEVGLDGSQFRDGSLLAYGIKSTEILTLNNEEALTEYEESLFYSEYQGKKKLEIIPHGYDTLLWTPQSKKMRQVYNYETFDQKEENKKYLTHKKELELIDNAPVITIHVESDFEYTDELEDWLIRQEEKEVFIVLTSLEKDVIRRLDEADIFGENFVFLKSSSNDELKNYIAASEFYIDLSKRDEYNFRFGISVPFGTVPGGERAKAYDQFVSEDEDEDIFNSVLVENIKEDFDSLIDRMIHIYKNMDMEEIQKRVISMLLSWEPSGLRIGKIYDNLH